MLEATASVSQSVNHQSVRRTSQPVAQASQSIACISQTGSRCVTVTNQPIASMTRISLYLSHSYSTSRTNDQCCSGCEERGTFGQFLQLGGGSIERGADVGCLHTERRLLLRRNHWFGRFGGRACTDGLRSLQTGSKARWDQKEPAPSGSHLCVHDSAFSRSALAQCTVLVIARHSLEKHMTSLPKVPVGKVG